MSVSCQSGKLLLGVQCVVFCLFVCFFGESGKLLAGVPCVYLAKVASYYWGFNVCILSKWPVTSGGSCDS